MSRVSFWVIDKISGFEKRFGASTAA